MAGLFRQLGRYPLATRVIGSVVVVSMLLALGTMALQLRYDFRTGQQEMNQRLDATFAAIQPALANAIWAIDEPVIELLLRGMLDLPEIRLASLSRASADPIEVGHLDASEALIERHYQIVASVAGDPSRFLGELTLLVSEEPLYRTLKDRARVILLSSFFKVTAMLTVFLLVFLFLVSRRVEALAQHADVIASTPELPAQMLLANPSRNDELGALERAIGHLGERLAREQRHNQTLQEQRQQDISQALAEQRQEQSFQAECLRRMESSVRELRGPLREMQGQQGDLRLKGVLDQCDGLLQVTEQLRQYLWSPPEHSTTQGEVLNLPDFLNELSGQLSELLADDGGHIDLLIQGQLPDRVRGEGMLLRWLIVNLVRGLAQAAQTRAVILQFQYQDAGQERLRVVVEDSSGAEVQVPLIDLQQTPERVPKGMAPGSLAGFLRLLQVSRFLQKAGIPFGHAMGPDDVPAIWVEYPLPTCRVAEDRLYFGTALALGFAGQRSRVLDYLFTAAGMNLHGLDLCASWEQFLDWSQESRLPTPRLVLVDLMMLRQEGWSEHFDRIKSWMVGVSDLVVVADELHQSDLDQIRNLGADLLLTPAEITDWLPGMLFLNPTEHSVQGLQISPGVNAFVRPEQ